MPAVSYFTESPRLFRLAPWLLSGLGLCLTVALALLVERRIEDGWRDSANGGFYAVESIATAVESQAQARTQELRQAVKLLKAAELSGQPEIRTAEVFRDGFGLAKGGVAYWLDSALVIRHSTTPAASGRTLSALRLRLDAADPPDDRLMVVAGTDMGAADLAWGLVLPHAIAGRAGYLVLAYPVARATEFTERALNARTGVLGVEDSSGRPLLVITPRQVLAPESFSQSAVLADNIEELRRLPPASKTRYLRAHRTLEDGGFRVWAAVSEHETLADWRSRRDATISMAVVMSGMVLSCLLLAAWALRSLVRSDTSLRKLVSLDPLTELPNRRTFTAMLQTEVERSRLGNRLTGLMFIDLDNFKDVNDSLGHEVGDLLLKSVAQRLRESVRESDVVCRLGGDEFTVVLPDVDEQSLHVVAQRILSKLAEPVSLPTQVVSTNASIGVAVALRDADTASLLVRCADMAVYTAKARGKGCVAFYDPSMAERSRERSLVAQDLRSALRREELFVVYQPKVDLMSGAVSGYEALIRWHHPKRGLVPPATFIPIAEESELILEIGDYVIFRVVTQMREWFDQGKGWRRVAVNVSARQLRDQQVVGAVRDALTRYNVPGPYLQVELTETMLAEDLDQARTALAQLKGLGVRVAVDDFGTGYSSLKALQQLDVNCIKVDRSFVAGIGNDHDSSEICRAIVNLAHSLELTVVAEGVETPAQLNYLRELGCTEGQGFLFAKPMLAEDAIDHAIDTQLFSRRCSRVTAATES